MKTARASFRLSLALLGLTAFVPPTLAHAEGKYAQSSASSAKKCDTKTGLTLDKGHKGSSLLPPFKKTGAHIETYGQTVTETYSAPVRVDPIVGKVEGAPLGGKITIQKLGKPNEVTMPDGKERRVDGPASVRKRANKKYNRELRKQIALAQNKTTILEIGADKITNAADSHPSEPYGGKTVSVSEPLVVPAHTPLDVTVTDKFSRSQTTRIDTEGQQRSTTSTRLPNNYIRSVDQGGELAGTMKPEVQTANLKVSRPYVRDGASYVKVFSAAAFTGNNAVVKVINRETGKEVPFKLSQYGAGAVEVPAYRKADLAIVVEYPAIAGKSLAAKSEFHLQAPDYAPSQSSKHAAYESVEVKQVQ